MKSGTIYRILTSDASGAWKVVGEISKDPTGWGFSKNAEDSKKDDRDKNDANKR